MSDSSLRLLFSKLEVLANDSGGEKAERESVCVLNYREIYTIIS